MHFFFTKQNSAAYTETDASQCPPLWLHPQGGTVTHSSSHRSLKASCFIPQYYFSLSCEMSINISLYCELMKRSALWVNVLLRHTFSPFEFGVSAEQTRLYSGFSIVTGLVFLLCKRGLRLYQLPGLSSKPFFLGRKKSGKQ